MGEDKTVEQSEYADLLTYAGVAELCGVKLQTAYQWGKRKMLPTPANKDLGEGFQSARPLWRRQDIVDWQFATGRHPSQQNKEAAK